MTDSALETFDNPDAVSQPQTAPQDALPSADEFFGAQKAGNDNQLPTADEFFSPKQPGAIDSTLNALRAPSQYATGQYVPNPDVQNFLKHTSVGRIMDAFDAGVKDEAGSQLGMEPETVESFRKAGIFNDYAKGEFDFGKALTEGVVTPAAVALNGAFSVMSGFGGAAQQAADEVGGPVPELTSYALNSPALSGIHPPVRALPPEIGAARANAVIGEGEAAYFGVKEPTPEQEAARHEAAMSVPETVSPEETPKAVEAAPDIHQMARNVAPQTFQEYDRLSTTRDTLGNWMREFSEKRQQEAEDNAPHNEEIAELQSKLEDANARKTKIYQAKIDDLTAKNQEFINDAVSKDTPEIAQVRQRYQEVDYRMRDLAPDVSKAYRTAQEFSPQEEPIREQSVPVKNDVIEQTRVAQEKGSEEELRSHVLSIEDQKANIASDVSQKLGAAGRPKEESDAAAQLVAAHYEARAERFNGNRGTAQEMYERDGANVKAGRERAKEFAQKQEKGRELEQSQRGKIRLATDDAKATITLMKSANASTFIHETGHHWTDELLKDASSEDAPSDIVQDASAVRKYVGAEDDAELTTKQHEKMARSFERFMMEGRAPNKELAGVFAKFKQWLDKIYQIVENLKAPITDDIRDVFNRLLTTNPEKPVIAPDHEPGKMMADIHEADAESTPPEKAADVADNIRSEIKQTAKTHDEAIYDAIKSAESSEDVPENSEVASGPSPESGQPSGETATPQQSPEVSAGGGQASGEGDANGNASGGNSGATDAGTAKPGKPSEPEPGSGTVLERPAGNLIDKAGNIRLDNLNTPEDVNQVIRETADQNNQFLAARRGVISDTQALDLADSLGMDAKTLNFRKIGEAFNAEQILAARKLLVQSATDLRDFMSKAATGSDADVLKYAEAKSRHIMIQEQVSGITAEAGRALRAFHKLEGGAEAQALGDFLKQTTGKDLFQLKEEAKLGASLDTPGKISKFINDSKKPSFGDQILEYWINGLISGPATHTTYMIGNALLGLWKAIPETAVASVVGKVHEAFGKDSGGVRAGEIGAQLKGAVESIPTALSAAGKALKTGATTLLPGEEAKLTPFQQATGLAEPGRVGNESMTWKQVGADAFGTMKGLRDGLIATGELVKSGGVEGAPTLGLVRSPLGSIPDVSIKGIQVPWGSTWRVPARAIAAIHSFFRTVNYSMEKSSLAYRQASDENLSGNSFSARVGELVTNPTEEIMNGARERATDLTLMGQGGDFTRALSRMTNASVNLPLLGQTKLLKFIDPFIHISANVIDQAILQRTPVGILSSEIRADLSGVNGAAARDFAQSRMIVGTALSVTAGGLAAEGLISGSGPSNSKDNSAWRMLGGNQPHSVKINGVWYDTHRLGPMGMIIGIAADMYDVAHAMSGQDATKVGAMLVHSITQNILDESFMRGPAELIKALTDSDRYGDSYIRNMISSFVPFSGGMSQETRAIDPYVRETRTVMDAIKAKIPFVSESLLPRRDVWGEPIANKDVLGPAGFSAIYESRVNNDPTSKALLNLGIYPSQPERKIRGVPLTDQQYDDYCRLAGRTTKMRLDTIIKQAGFTNLPAASQIDAIRKTIEKARESARSLVMMQNPSIFQQAMRNKADPLHGKKVVSSN